MAVLRQSWSHGMTATIDERSVQIFGIALYGAITRSPEALSQASVPRCILSSLRVENAGLGWLRSHKMSAGAFSQDLKPIPM